MPHPLAAQPASLTKGGKAEVGNEAVSDTVLARLAQSGDREAMASLFARHEVAVFRLAYRVLHCADNADDVRQETFVRVFGSLSRFRQDATFRTYALAICSNLCRDRLRENKRRPESLYGLAPGDAILGADGDPATQCVRGAENERVRCVVASLSPAHRETLHLRYVEELSADEIARVAGCSRLAVPVRVFRAKKAFEAAYRAQELQEGINLL